MDRESYENETIAAYINANFIPIKIDRDSRPDLDRRFQAAVQALVGSGGWPLTAFLTPGGRVFFGGTYFAPKSSADRIGLDRLLPQIVQAFHAERESVESQADQLFARLGSIRSKLGEGRGAG